MQKSCINCGPKTHATRDCQETERKKSERPCFNCGKPGHESRACPEKEKGRRPVKAIMDAPTRKPEVLAVQHAPRRPAAAVFAIQIAPPTVASFLKAVPARKQNSNRFQPLSTEMRQEFASESQSSAPTKLASAPSSVCVCILVTVFRSFGVSRTPGLEILRADEVQTNLLSIL